MDENVSKLRCCVQAVRGRPGVGVRAGAGRGAQRGRGAVPAGRRAQAAAGRPQGRGECCVVLHRFSQSVFTITEKSPTRSPG